MRDRLFELAFLGIETLIGHLERSLTSINHSLLPRMARAGSNFSAFSEKQQMLFPNSTGIEPKELINPKSPAFHQVGFDGKDGVELSLIETSKKTKHKRKPSIGHIFDAGQEGMEEETLAQCPL